MLPASDVGFTRAYGASTWIDEAGNDAHRNRLQELRTKFSDGAMLHVRRLHRLQHVEHGPFCEYVELRASGMWYHADTEPRVVAILDQFRKRSRVGQRLRLHYGDVQTGRDWMDIHDVTGYIGSTMGPVKQPILLPKSDSMGGGIILDNCIVRIRHANKKHGGDLYRHPSYYEPSAEEQARIIAEWAK